MLVVAEPLRSPASTTGKTDPPAHGEQGADGAATEPGLDDREDVRVLREFHPLPVAATEPDLDDREDFYVSVAGGRVALPLRSSASTAGKTAR